MINLTFWRGSNIERLISMNDTKTSDKGTPNNIKRIEKHKELHLYQ